MTVVPRLASGARRASENMRAFDYRVSGETLITSGCPLKSFT